MVSDSRSCAVSRQIVCPQSPSTPPGTTPSYTEMCLYNEAISLVFLTSATYISKQCWPRLALLVYNNAMDTLMPHQHEAGMASLLLSELPKGNIHTLKEFLLCCEMVLSSVKSCVIFAQVKQPGQTLESIKPLPVLSMLSCSNSH